MHDAGASGRGIPRGVSRCPVGVAVIALGMGLFCLLYVFLAWKLITKSTVPCVAVGALLAGLAAGLAITAWRLANRTAGAHLLAIFWIWTSFISLAIPLVGAALLLLFAIGTLLQPDPTIWSDLLLAIVAGLSGVILMGIINTLAANYLRLPWVQRLYGVMGELP